MARVATRAMHLPILWVTICLMLGVHRGSTADRPPQTSQDQHGQRLSDRLVDALVKRVVEKLASDAAEGTLREAAVVQPLLHERHRHQDASLFTAPLGGASLSECDKAVATAQNAMFKAGRANNYHWANCPRFQYLSEVAASVEGPVTIFDIGCNKGYDSMMFFEAFNPGLGVNRSMVYSAFKKVFADINENFCGACEDCRSFPLFHSQLIPPKGNAVVHCFEPGEVNYDRLVRIKKHMFVGKDGSRWPMERLAFGNATGTVHFKKNCSGELCSIDESGQDADIVNATTVDDMVQRLGLTRLFILKIDTEGFDPLVLDGAERLLAARNVDLLMFEYHGFNYWNAAKGRSLKDTAARLAQYGYACYFEGNILTRITNCWHDEMEYRDWANIVCALQGSRAHHALDKKSFMRLLYPWMYVNF